MIPDTEDYFSHTGEVHSNEFLRQGAKGLIKACLEKLATIPEFQKALTEEYLKLPTMAISSEPLEIPVRFEHDGSKVQLTYKKSLLHVYNRDADEELAINIYELQLDKDPTD